jgi:hypothetical protein
MRRMRWAPIVVGIYLLLALPGVASAAVLAPPGHAGANQYFETIPTSAGNAAPPGSVNGSGSANGHTPSRLGRARAGSARLSHLGTQGKAAAALAAATAPTPAPGATSEQARNGSGPANLPSAEGGSTGGALANALAGSTPGGIGVLLPLLLATAAIAAIGVAVARLRHRGAGPQAKV